MHATPEQTRAFFETRKLHPDKIRSFQNLSLSSIGIGTYLGESDDITDQFYLRSLLSSVNHGVNVFDTAGSYRCARSEKLIGKALKELEAIGVAREQLFLSTKGGYIALPEDGGDFDSHVRSQYIEKGLIKSGDLIDGCHCLSPAFLEHELEKSLERLNVSSIDVYYLHNPEVHLAEISPAAFQERLSAAFEFLEKKVAEGKIQNYGFATWNGFRLKKSAKCHLSLPLILKLAKKAGGESHHFKAVQLPFNLVMLEAHKLCNQHAHDEDEKPLSLLKCAHENKIAAFISAPLMQAKILNLPKRIFEGLPMQATPIQKALQFVLSTPYVTSTLIGMKTVSHVHENLNVLQEPNWSADLMKAAYKLLGI